MSIDFTDIHTFRIPSADFRYEVFGSSLDKLGQEAYRYAVGLFVDRPFSIDHMNIEVAHDVLGDDKHVALYRADVTVSVR